MKAEVCFTANGLVPELTLWVVGAIEDQPNPTRGTPQSDRLFDDQESDILISGGYDVPYVQTTPPTATHEGSLSLSRGEFGTSSRRLGFCVVSSHS